MPTRPLRAASALALLGLALPRIAAADDTLIDPQGFTWDFDSVGNGSVIGGSDDAYDSYGMRCISNGILYPATCTGTGTLNYTSTGGLLSGGNTVTMSQLSGGTLSGLGSLRVRRVVYVPQTGAVGFARIVDSFTNNGTSSITFKATFGTALAADSGDLGSDSSTSVTGTSSGDLSVTVADRWVATTDGSILSPDPSLGFVFQGPAATLSLASLAYTGTSARLAAGHSVTVAPGQTVRLMTFLTQQDTDAEALTLTGQLAALDHIAVQLAGISNTELLEIKNWDLSGAVDLDGDGARAATDCNDGDATIRPGVDELCDGVDNNCDGTIDEGSAVDALTYYDDVDGDGFGDPGTATPSCAAPTGAVLDDTDCDDTDGLVSPDATEACDSVDNDCDGDIDEAGALGESTFHPDGDGDGYGDPSSAVVDCEAPLGYVADDTDCDDDQRLSNPAAAESCDGADNDCDGTIDGPTAVDARTFYTDGDNDGYGGSTAVRSCLAGPGLSINNLDCNDALTDVNPAEPERCFTPFDDNCDGRVNEGTAVDARTFYADSDTDGFGDPASSTAACTVPTGFVANNTDCDDRRSSSFPGATERCNTFDDDCDAVIDEPDAVDATIWYRDADTDGYGTSSTGLLSSQRACAAPSGFVASNTDCNDAALAVNPGAVEVCNSIDDNCDGGVDLGAVDALSTYRDGDTDGFGDPASLTLTCALASGFVLDSGDCDDSRALVFPGAAERCDGLDDDCDGIVPAAEIDDDGDTFVECLEDVAGWQASVVSFGDCDDADPAAFPGATELPYDGIDQDCDGDDQCDVDGDGFVAEDCAGDDCDDAEAEVNPDATERYYDGVDDNCVPADDDDMDGDGYASATYGGEDCDDAATDTYPGAPDTTYDGIINDCDSSDEYDADGDGFDAETFGGSDCDDSNSSVRPGAEESWYDGVDEDCDGIDDDQDRDGYVVEEDCDDTDPEVYPGAPGFNADCTPDEGGDGNDGADGSDGADGADGADGGDPDLDSDGLATGDEEAGAFAGGTGKVGCATTGAPRGGLAGALLLLSGWIASLGRRRR